MKKIVLLSSIVFLFAACSNKTANSTTNQTSSADTAGVNEDVLPIAIVNVDTVLANYKFATESNDNLMSKQEDARVELNQKAEKLKQEMADFQRKVQNNAFLSRERAESEQRRLVNKQNDLQTLDQQRSQELMSEQQRLSAQLRDSIDMAISLLNKEGKYKLVLSTNSMNDNVLFASPEYDVTNKLLGILNSRYTSH